MDHLAPKTAELKQGRQLYLAHYHNGQQQAVVADAVASVASLREQAAS